MEELEEWDPEKDYSKIYSVIRRHPFNIANHKSLESRKPSEMNSANNPSEKNDPNNIQIHRSLAPVHFLLDKELRVNNPEAPSIGVPVPKVISNNNSSGNSVIDLRKSLPRGIEPINKNLPSSGVPLSNFVPKVNISDNQVIKPIFKLKDNPLQVSENLNLPTEENKIRNAPSMEMQKRPPSLLEKAKKYLSEKTEVKHDLQDFGSISRKNPNPSISNQAETSIRPNFFDGSHNMVFASEHLSSINIEDAIPVVLKVNSLHGNLKCEKIVNIKGFTNLEGFG